MSELLAGCAQFQRLLGEAIDIGQLTVAVAGANEPDVLTGLAVVADLDLARPLLVGPQDEIVRAAEQAGISLAGMEIVHAPDDISSAVCAVQLVRDGKAKVLMKGRVDSVKVFRAVLDRDHGLRGNGLLSHIAIYDGPNCPRLWIMTDGGMNVAPDLKAKKLILLNAVRVARCLGIDCPRVAVISSLERPDPAVPSTLDAEQITEAGKAGEFGRAIVEGPLALDVALSPVAARKKGVDSEVSGRVDIFLVPNIESGNILGKSMMYLAGAKMAGVVSGATAPVLLNSRADVPAGKLASMVVAAHLARSSEEN